MKFIASTVSLLGILWRQPVSATSDVCQRLGHVAFDIAEQRVAGTPLSGVMAEIDTLEYNRFSDVNSLDPTALGEAITEMAIAIYDTVVWSDRTFPALMRNIVELECYKESR